MSANGLRVYVLCGGLLELDLGAHACPTAPEDRAGPCPCRHSSSSTVGAAFSSTPAFTARRSRIRWDACGETRAGRFGMRSQPGDEVVSQLGLLGVPPDDASPEVANSHFHFDHCGGNEFFRRSTFAVQRKELEARGPRIYGSEQRYAQSAQDFGHPLAYRPDRREHDVFGDGTVVLHPDAAATRPATSPSGCARERAAIWSWPPTPCYTRENTGPGSPAGRALGRRRDGPLTRAAARAPDRQGRPSSSGTTRLSGGSCRARRAACCRLTLSLLLGPAAR